MSKEFLKCLKLDNKDSFLVADNDFVAFDENFTDEELEYFKIGGCK